MADSEARRRADRAVYRLPAAEAQLAASGGDWAAADAVLLQRNALWFCRLRWIVVALLAGLGAAALLAPEPAAWGLRLQPTWPLAAAAVLAGLNGLYLVWGPWRKQRDYGRIRRHIRLQIAADLLVLTVVIHYLGSVETVAPFMYLFHIILSCIFFPRWESLAVTGAAAALYLACLAVEWSGWAPPTTVLASPALAPRAALPVSFWTLRLSSLFLIWAVIWLLASRLAGELRARERQLQVTNERLRASSEERMRHMLQTTHQLKAPLAAIHANAQLLEQGFCGPLPDKARGAARRIAQRCASLARHITDMLQLANLRSQAQAPPAPVACDAAELVREAVRRVAPTATLRDIAIDARLDAAPVAAVEDHLKMLLDNLLSNAVTYSYDGGRVDVTCRPLAGGGAEVTIRDHGIGVAPERLPAIFRDYYRTPEAARHNRLSSGLGLAIVRQVARLAGVAVEVESGPGWGTRFTLTIPPSPPRSPPGSRKPDRGLAEETGARGDP